jgi:hypothetical protein
VTGQCTILYFERGIELGLTRDWQSELNWVWRDAAGVNMTGEWTQHSVRCVRYPVWYRMVFVILLVTNFIHKPPPANAYWSHWPMDWLSNCLNPSGWWSKLVEPPGYKSLGCWLSDRSIGVSVAWGEKLLPDMLLNCFVVYDCEYRPGSHCIDMSSVILSMVNGWHPSWLEQQVGWASGQLVPGMLHVGAVCCRWIEQWCDALRKEPKQSPVLTTLIAVTIDNVEKSV